MVDPRRLFKEMPPVEPLTTLAACVRDWDMRYIKGPFAKHRDLVIDFTRDAPDFRTAADRACRSRNAQGVMWNHQSRVPLVTLLIFRDIIISYKKNILHIHKSLGFDAFENIHQFLWAYRPLGIGPVTAYDVAVRLCAFLDVEPQLVYLHAGPTMGWRLICDGLDNPGLWARTRSKGFIEKADLPQSLRVLPMDQVEDVLCAYRHVFEDTVLDFR